MDSMIPQANGSFTVGTDMALRLLNA
jgi:hypothetical protein